MDKCDEKKGKNIELIEALEHIIKNMSQLIDEEMKSSFGDETLRTD